MTRLFHFPLDAGRNYYLAPKFTKFADYRDGAEANGPDVDDNYEGTMDVNNDGRPDVLSSGWMRRQGIWWYEDPGKTGVKWDSHALLEADGVEGMVIGNLSGRSEKDVLVNYFARKPGRGLMWLEHLDQAPWFKQGSVGHDGLVTDLARGTERAKAQLAVNDHTAANPGAEREKDHRARFAP